MSWRDAPLYIEVHDLAREVLGRAPAWTAAGHALVATAAGGAALDLLAAVAQALTFPDTRPTHLVAADQALVRLRAILRVAQELDLLGAGAARALHGRTLLAGRMIGGWRKRVAGDPSIQLPPGRGPPSATGA